jgi:hypothetical protein
MKINEVYLNKEPVVMTENKVIVEPYKIKLLEYLGSDDWRVHAIYQIENEHVPGGLDKFDREDVIISGAKIYQKYRKL